MSLKWKTFLLPTVTAGSETLVDALAGLSGANRVLKFITGSINTGVYLRVYRDGEQIVDYNSYLLTAYAPLLPVEVAIGAGQLLKVGFYNKAGTATTPTISIGYTESD
jgi:hypothetical protein